MARAKYTVTASDMEFVAKWVTRQLQLCTVELRVEVTFKTALARFNEASNTDSSMKEQAEAVNSWCEEYLPKRAWELLKASIRKRRQRTQSRGQSESITISKRAHALLKKLATRDNVTYSEVLERYLSKALSGLR